MLAIKVNENKESGWVFLDYIKIIPALSFAIIIFYFSSIPNPVPPAVSATFEFDINTILHICEYAIFSFLVSLGWKYKMRDSFLIIFPILYAISDEIHQYFVPNRFFDFFDILADVIGVILGFLLYLLIEKLYNNHLSKEISI